MLVTAYADTEGRSQVENSRFFLTIGQELARSGERSFQGASIAKTRRASMLRQKFCVQIEDRLGRRKSDVLSQRERIAIACR